MRSFVASHLRDMNRRTVYDLISSVGEISRAEISRKTGISSPTVLKIIDFFCENGFVTEAGEGDSPLGRKPQILRFNPEVFFSIGIDFEGDFLKLGIVDLLGNVKVFKQIKVHPDYNEIINEKLCVYIDNLIKQSNIPKSKFLGVGLGIPGVVDPDNKIIEFGPLIGISSKTDCRDSIENLSQRLELPVYIENDVNAAAIGEFVTRKLSSDSDLVYVSIGTGLGAGIVLNGRLRRGTRNCAGEIGYMVFDNDYHTSKAKAGWMESRINFDALSKKWSSFSLKESQDYSNKIKNSNDFKSLINYVASDLALCIANIVTLMDIELAVIGGISAELLGDGLVKKTCEYLARLSVLDVNCQLSKCVEPGIVGAASIVTENTLDRLLAE